MDVLGVLARVLHGDFVADPVDFARKVDHVVVQHVAGAVQMLDKLDDPSLVEELVAFVHPHIPEADSHAAVQESQLLQPLVEHVEVVLRRLEDGRVGLERRLRAALGDRPDPLDRTGGNAPFVFLLVDVAVPADLDLAPLRQEIDHGHADPVQTARRLVDAFLELAAELQHGHDAFERRNLAPHLFGQLLMRLDRDPAPVVLDGDRPVAVDDDVDVLGKAGHRFVDRVVDDFVH